MPTPDEERALAAESYEYASDDDDEVNTHETAFQPTPSSSSTGTGPEGGRSRAEGGRGGRQFPIRSHYHLSNSERLKGVANRIIFSRYYVLFYFVMMCLSMGTVILSLVATHKKQCPPVVWHILEVIVNGLMVLEVSTRWVAYGKSYPMTPLNIIDLLLVLFCSITLILVFRSPCAEGTRREEVLDTILLVIRNAVQFLRLGNILRRSGHSLLNPPKPIDLSNARTASLALNLDLDLDDEEAVAERHLANTSSSFPSGGEGQGGGGRRTLVGSRSGGTYEPIFQDDVEEDEGEDDERAGAGGRRSMMGQRGTRKSGDALRKPLDVRGDRGREGLNGDDEEMWDRLG